MAESNVPITAGSGTKIDTFVTASNANNRQAIVIADPSVDANAANVVTADPGPSSTLPGVVMRLAGSAQVQIAGSSGSIAVYFDRGNPSVNIGNSGTLTVAFDSSRGFLQGINTSLAVYFDRGNPSVTVANVGTGSIGVFYSPSNPSVSISNTPSVVTTNISGMSNTAGIFTTSSSYTGNALAGATIISPSANYSFKIFAFSLSTTAQSNIFAKFTNGASSTPTEYWRVALQAPTAGISGANLAVTPPGHLWATGTSTTLSLVLDSASLVHYSVSYIKETS